MKTFIAGLLALTFVTGCTQPHAQVKTRRLSATEEYHLRGECANLVAQKAKMLGWDFVGVALTANTVSHYNSNTNRCYALSTHTKEFGFYMPSVPDDYLVEALYDAQTEEELAFLDNHCPHNGSKFGFTFGHADYDRAKTEDFINNLMTDAGTEEQQ